MIKYLSVALLLALIALPSELFAQNAATTSSFLSQPITTEMVVRTSAIICLFVLIASLIATRKLPAMIALPVMAIGIGLCAGIPVFDPVQEIDGKKVPVYRLIDEKRSPVHGSFSLHVNGTDVPVFVNGDGKEVPVQAIIDASASGQATPVFRQMDGREVKADGNLSAVINGEKVPVYRLLDWKVVPSQGILTAVIEGKPTEGSGMFMLSLAIIYSLLGGMFARFINDAKIAERLIKYAAEFGGEDPFFISVMLCSVTVLIFTAIGGLPAIIMVGTIMFPILLSLGISPVVCGCLLALSYPVGSALAPQNWGITANMYGIEQSTTLVYFVAWATLQFAVLLLFLIVEFSKMKRTNVTAASMFRSISTILLVIFLFGFLGYFENLGSVDVMKGAAPILNKLAGFRHEAFVLLQYLISAILIFGIVYTQFCYHVKKKLTSQWNLVTPLLPLLLILALGFDKSYGAAFICALGYGFMTTPGDRSIQRLGKTIIAGVGDIAAPVVLMLGIGMLVSAAMHPVTNDILTPVLARLIPAQNVTTYVLFFAFFAPFALYRGPLNEWGLGVGVARILQNFMPAPATMGAIKAVSLLQDPTTTQNIWICGYLKLDINAILFKLLPYSFGLVVLSLILSAKMFL